VGRVPAGTPRPPHRHGTPGPRVAGGPVVNAWSVIALIIVAVFAYFILKLLFL
jgi:hypothetical protein